jgi:hypothetical protein
MKPKLVFLIAGVIFALPFIHQNLNAQNIAVTDSTEYTPESSAMLDVQSNYKGLLVPRMDSSKRVNIASPATGLLVFDTGANGFFYYNGSDWVSLSTQIVSPESAGVNDAIFSVVNTDGDTVFAVYPKAVTINVGSGVGKANRGGFAVGGLTGGAKQSADTLFFSVTPDSVRVYIDTTPDSKGNRGGFAVGGLTSMDKNPMVDFLSVSYDSVRVYIDTVTNSKGNRGGFAVGGLTKNDKGNETKYFNVNNLKTNFFTVSKTDDQNYIDWKIKYEDFTKADAEFSLIHSSDDSVMIGVFGDNIETDWYPKFYVWYKTAGDFKDKVQVCGPMLQITPDNVAMGAEAGKLLRYNTNIDNVLIGNWSGNYCTGDGNVLVGTSAGSHSGLDDYNVALGYKAGRNCQGSSNVFLGPNAGYYETTSNKLFIANSADTDQATDRTSALIYGEFDNSILRFNADVGINTVPSSELDVNGDIELPNTQYIYFGDPTTTGTIRMYTEGGNLKAQKYNGSDWTTNGTKTITDWAK